MSVSTFLLFAADTAGYAVGSGRIQGGWGYVVASYVLTYVALVLYTLSLWLRRKAQRDLKEP
jgi:hypothetical protein